jgi:hypothetical protein
LQSRRFQQEAVEGEEELLLEEQEEQEQEQEQVGSAGVRILIEML